MKYTKEECLEFIREEKIEFILLSFVDIRGRMRTTTIMPGEAGRAFSTGISIDGSAIEGYETDGVHSDLFLHPDPDTLSLLPWRPDQGKAVRFFSYVTFPDGTPVSSDSRWILSSAVGKAAQKGLSFYFGTEYEFYLFPLNDDGTHSSEPVDSEGYMASAPLDRGEGVRREICLALEELSLHPEASHHEEGPGQNEIDFCYSPSLEAADNGMTFCQIVRTVSERSGLYADFSPKPIPDKPGNGLHINISVRGGEGNELEYITAGIMKYIREMTLILNPGEDSYRRLGSFKAPSAVSYSYGNRSQLIRIPAAEGEYVRAELRSPDAGCNLYIALALLIYASLEGIGNRLTLPSADDGVPSTCEVLPHSLAEAEKVARDGDFLRRYLPPEVLRYFIREERR